MVEGGGERGEIFPRQKTIEFLGGESRSEGESTVEAQSYFEIARLITFISFCFRDIYFCFFNPRKNRQVSFSGSGWKWYYGLKWIDMILYDLTWFLIA